MSRVVTVGRRVVAFGRAAVLEGREEPPIGASGQASTVRVPGASRHLCS